MNAIDTVFWCLAIAALIVPMLTLLFAAGRRASRRGTTQTMPRLAMSDPTSSMSFKS